MAKKIESCLICGQDIQYFKETKEMNCFYCNKLFPSNASCIKNHYVCDECHSKKAIESIMKIAKEESSKNPLEIAVKMMKNPNVHMHGPENHVLIGSALLTAYKNNGGKLDDFNKSLLEIRKRGSQVPGGICGNWGCCGAAVSSGIFISVITDSSPLSKKPLALSTNMTSKALARIGEIGGPRCCKRNGFLTILEAVKYVEEVFDIQMKISDNFKCEFYDKNKECIANMCPFFKK